MRIVVVGATGNHGSSLVRRLSRDPEVTSIVGVARRRPEWTVEKVSWVTADISRDDVELEPIFTAADAVVHLAWLIQPARNERITHATNVEGSSRVFTATARAGVPALIHASSIGTYSEGPKDRGVTEDWPTDGIASSYYSRHKAACERMLDSLEAAHPDLRVVRIRPGLVFKREAATQIRRLFVGPFLPRALVRRDLLPVLPVTERLRVQCVHTEDLAEAYRLAIVRPDARGAYNIAADPVLDGESIGRELGARPVKVPAAALRAGASAAFHARLIPVSPDWVDMGLGVPIMDTTRAQRELGWEPRRDALETLGELFDGLREGGDFTTPPLAAETSGPARIREVLTGVGSTSR